MNLNSKRIAAALVTLAAFTGVLIKDIPFTADTPEAPDALLADNSLGDMALLSTNGEILPQNAQNPKAAPGVGAAPFAAEDSSPSVVFAAASLDDKPGSSRHSALPNPVGSTAASHTDRGPTPFFAPASSNASTGGGGGGGGNGGGGGGSGGGSGGGAGGGSGVDSPGNGGGANTPETVLPPLGPIVNNPNTPVGDSEQNNPTPQEPNQPPSTDLPDTDNPGLPPTNVELPTGDGTDKDPIIPPWTEDPLPDDPTFPMPDDPTSPGGNTHHVPDSGSSVVLLGAALVSILALRRKFAGR